MGVVKQRDIVVASYHSKYCHLRYLWYLLDYMSCK